MWAACYFGSREPHWALGAFRRLWYDDHGTNLSSMTFYETYYRLMNFYQHAPFLDLYNMEP